MRATPWAAMACLLLAQAGAPAGAQTPPPGMGTQSSTPQKIVWSCQVDQLGSVPVMVNFVDKTALSTRATAIAKATIEGDVVRWQEDDGEGGRNQFVLNRRSGELQVTQTPAKGKPAVHRGQCGAPDKTKKKGH